MPLDDSQFAGRWRCTYWYPSNEQVADEPSEYIVTAHVSGDEVVFESVPNEEQSYMLVRLKIEDGIATGSWHETTSPTGAFKGAQYSGYGQLIVHHDSGNMEGKWAGAGFDHKLQAMRIYSGNWEIVHEQEAVA